MIISWITVQYRPTPWLDEVFDIALVATSEVPGQFSMRRANTGRISDRERPQHLSRFLDDLEELIYGLVAENNGRLDLALLVKAMPDRGTSIVFSEKGVANAEDFEAYVALLESRLADVDQASLTVDDSLHSDVVRLPQKLGFAGPPPRESYVVRSDLQPDNAPSRVGVAVLSPPSTESQPVRAFTSFSDILRRFEGQRVVTIATGTTCAYLGDERNLREYLVADEAARLLRDAGHLVHFILFDDNLDPLNFRQLRVAVDKDPGMIAKWESECGKPISEIADPWGCHMSFAAHFEAGFMSRLSRLGCNPTLVGTSRLYSQGAYRSFIEIVLLQHEEILRFLRRSFPNYHPQKLFQPICPDCGRIDSTDMRLPGIETTFFCSRCERTYTSPAHLIRGRLSWKLDQAAKWAMYNIDTEPFSLAYLEPREGSFVVARALGREFFGAASVMPIRYGLVTMPRELGGKLFQSLPPQALRSLMVERWKSELDITADRVRLEASRYQVAPGVSFADAVKQFVPTWLLSPQNLSLAEREILAAGTAYAEHFGASALEVRLPSRAAMAQEPIYLLASVADFLDAVHRLRLETGDRYEEFDSGAKSLIESLGASQKTTVACVRRLVGQEKGVPTRRLLFHLPEDYLRLVADMADLTAEAQMPISAQVQVPLQADNRINIPQKYFLNAA